MALPAPPAPQSDLASDPASSELTYRYRPRMIGGDFAFRLEPDALAWELGRRNGRLAYRDIARLRLGYRPPEQPMPRSAIQLLHLVDNGNFRQATIPLIAETDAELHLSGLQ